MTVISNFESYKLHNRVFLVDDSFKLIDIGVFDPDWNIGGDITYKAGKFIDFTGKQFYNDSLYHGKPCIVFSFKHKLFGNWPVLRKLGRGHFHDKYIVSTSSIKPHDVMYQADNGDIFIFASLVRDPPMHTEEGTDPYETLYEVKPYLSQDDLDKLSKDARFVTKIKEKHAELASEVHELKVDNYIAHVRASVADATIIGMQDTINSLLKNNASTLDKVIAMKLESQQKYLTGIEMAESQGYSGVPWEQVNIDTAERAAASLQTELRIIAGMTQLNGGLTDNQKQMLVLQVANIVGIEYMRRMLLGMERHVITTPTGEQAFMMSKKPSPTEVLMRYAQQRESGQISTEEYYQLLIEFLDAMKKEAATTDVNAAVEKAKEELLRVQHPPTPTPTAR